ncbi:chromatin accessibility complex 16kD protein-like [Lutzomyia longipalpis]|uniref:chromatin accessibility complex 16kD protein-like n=1 Tax=Lutzomyia longipalpis TaxID=7200 RepID=UPI0024837B7C|nr:chromatin accessibility complex 16kD protein-like [Lutzomyia longipalpis]XP_055689056.1 chromatin accessibility complex 16kD protein-like [Lutzomyia longipalpis]
MSENQAKTIISVNKIRTIMKSSADVGSITAEAIQLVSKSTELFIGELVQNALKECEKQKGGAGGAKNVDYKSLAEYVQSESKLEFLQQMIPKKITVKEYRELLRKSEEENVQEISDDDESSSVCSSDSGNADDAISISSASVVEVKN